MTDASSPLRRRTVTAILMLAGLCAAAPALAAPFLEQVGRWTVFSLGRSCMAINRDVEEFNFAPYNALSFVQAAGTDAVKPRLYAWPGAFVPESALRLGFGLPGVNLPVSLTAKATSDFTVEADGPLPADKLEPIAKAGMLTVQVTGAAAPVKPLAFRTEDLAKAFEALGRCAKGL